MKFKKYLENISWRELEKLVGSQVLQRGESYFNRGRVTNLAIYSEGIVANVRGSDDYYSLVSFDHSSAAMSFDCTCPYGSYCKHSVAVTLAYIDAIKSNKDVPEVFDSDFRVKRIKEGSRQDDLEDEFDVGESYRHASLQHDANEELIKYLSGFSKEGLIDMVVKFSSSHPTLKKDLMDQMRLSTGKAAEIASSIRKEIKSIMSEPAWRNHWSGERNLADFSRVQKNLQNLLNQEKYDIVVELLKFLLGRAKSYVESSNDDGDSAMQITECLSIGFLGLLRSSTPVFEKLIFAINCRLEDEYELCQGADEIINSIADENCWSKIADDFYERLQSLPSSRSRDIFSRRYYRDRVSNYLVLALKQSGRDKEILPLYEIEARRTNSWERLVNLLIEKQQYEEALARAEEGIKSIAGEWPGIVKSLRGAIATIAVKQGDFDKILILNQEEFLDRPDLSSFETLLISADKTKNKEEIKSWAIHYLETGKIVGGGRSKQSRKSPSSYAQEKFPMYQVLIDIAEKEKRIDDVWKLYQEASGKKIHLYSRVRIANIIKEKFPDDALKIWDTHIDSLLLHANPASYREAVNHLKDIKKVFIKLKREKEWESYLNDLRDQNKRRPRFLQELRRITDDKLF